MTYDLDMTLNTTLLTGENEGCAVQVGARVADTSVTRGPGRQFGRHRYLYFDSFNLVALHKISKTVFHFP